jgi:hypothetical protein
MNNRPFLEKAAVLVGSNDLACGYYRAEGVGDEAQGAAS